MIALQVVTLRKSNPDLICTCVLFLHMRDNEYEYIHVNPINMLVDYLTSNIFNNCYLFIYLLVSSDNTLPKIEENDQIYCEHLNEFHCSYNKHCLFTQQS